MTTESMQPKVESYQWYYDQGLRLSGLNLSIQQQQTDSWGSIVIIPSGLVGIITEDDFMQQPLAFNIVISLTVLYSIISLFSSTGNVLQLIVVFTGKYIKTAVDFYIASLSVTNLINAMLNVPFVVYYMFKNEWRLGLTACKFVKYVEGVAVLSGMLVPLALAVNSYMLVFHALRLRRYIEKNVVPISISIIWIIAFTVTVPLIISHNLNFKLKYDMEKGEITGGGYLCDAKYDVNWGINSQIYVTSLFIIIYIIPFCMSLVLHTKVLHHQWITKPIDILPKFAPKTEKNFEQKRREIIISVLISLAYYLSYFPIIVTHIYQLFNPNVILNRVIVNILNMIGCSTGITGPLIYILLNKAAKERLVTIVTCTCCSEDEEDIFMETNRAPRSSRLSTLTANTSRDNRRRSSVMWHT